MIEDPIRAGIASGWKVFDASALSGDVVEEADVAIIGTGAGGGVSAELLARAGLEVVMLEEGPLRSSADFRMREPQAYAELYQEGGARRTKDRGLFILQGRSVGGSTTVNWTSSFRTPDSTLRHWATEYGLGELAPAAMAPWFDMMEARLSIVPWSPPPNANNEVLRTGAQKLGLHHGVVPRNVAGCWNLGYCGMGCPTNAKQSMLVTTIPAALSAGARLYHRVRVERFDITAGGRIRAAEGIALDGAGRIPSGRRVSIRARHFVLAAGGINSPALLLRSGAPDPYGRLGRRTFLHPAALTQALMPGTVDAFHGAPQTVYSDQFAFDDLAGPIGYKLEAAAIHPIFAATVLQPGFGEDFARDMAKLPRMQSLLALLRDGFHPDSTGGQVELGDDGRAVLDYPVSGYVWQGLRRALLSMAEIQFAAGATHVRPAHLDARYYTNWPEAREEIARLSLKLHRFVVGSAHVMGGCGMGANPALGVVDGNGRHHQIGNLSVFDGSVFPTSIGANPQLSIYALTARNATQLARTLSAAADTTAR